MDSTARVKYVFLDVVGFTKNRSVEAQSDVIAAINWIVLQSLRVSAIPAKDIVLLPTGDGIAICLIEVPGFDIHLRLAVSILGLVAGHNEAMSDQMRKFEIRVGINENVDNVLADINGRRSVAGAGISTAQRIMDKADGGQILVGSTVFDTLRQRELYMSAFRGYAATGKHDVTFPVYQYLAEQTPGLNVAVPSSFITKKQEPARLTKFIAYYFAHAIANRNFLVSRKGDALRNEVATVLLSHRAHDSEAQSDAGAHEDVVVIKTWGGESASFEEQYRHYHSNADTWLFIDLAGLFCEKHLSRYNENFEAGHYERSYWLVNSTGIRKLINEWPDIAEKFGIVHDGGAS